MSYQILSAFCFPQFPLKVLIVHCIETFKTTQYFLFMICKRNTPNYATFRKFVQIHKMPALGISDFK